MDNLPNLKPFKPKFKINETTDQVTVEVTLKPRDKKRRLATKVTTDDLKEYLEVAGITVGSVINQPKLLVTNQNIEVDLVTEWTFTKRDLRVKSTPPKTTTERKTKTKTSTKGK